jgi:hypothetical protein
MDSHPDQQDCTGGGVPGHEGDHRGESRCDHQGRAHAVEWTEHQAGGYVALTLRYGTVVAR